MLPAKTDFLSFCSDPNWEQEAHTKPSQETNHAGTMCLLNTYAVPRIAGEHVHRPIQNDPIWGQH